MLAELRLLVAKRPFSPFVIHMADGEAVRVPTVDHIATSPTGNHIVVFTDRGSPISSPLY